MKRSANAEEVAPVKHPESIRARSFGAAVVLTTALACSAEPSTERAVGGGITIDPDPFLLVDPGSPEGTTIESVRWATRLSDGGFAIADQYGAVLHLLDSEGTVHRSVGRRGEGPGEFGNIMWLDRCGTDSLFIWDGTRRVVHVTDAAGTFVRDFRPQPAPWELSCSRAGWMGALGLPIEYLPPAADGRRASAPVWIMDREGTALSDTVVVPIGDNRPLGRRTGIAAGGAELWVGTADSAWVDRRDLTGRLVGGTPVGVSGRTPTPEQFESSLVEMTTLSPNPRAQEIQRRQYEPLPIPEELPPYQHLFADPEGLLWAVTSAPGDPETAFMAVSPDGTVVFEGAVPRAVRVFEVGADYLLGKVADELGQESLVAFRIRRAAS